MSDLLSSSSDEENAEYHTCDEDEDEDEKPDVPRAASPSSSSSEDGRDPSYYYHTSDDDEDEDVMSTAARAASTNEDGRREKEEEELDVLGSAPVVAVRKETRQLHTRSVTASTNEDGRREKEEEELDVLGSAPVVAVRKETRQLHTRSVTASTNEDGRREKEEEELDVLGSAPVVAVRKETRQLHTRSVTASTNEDGRREKEEEEELDVLGSAPVVAVRKETRRLHARSVTGVGQCLQEILQSCDLPNNQLVPTSSSQQAENSLAVASGSALIGCSTSTLNVQLNVTQQQFGDVTVEKATHVNQSFGGTQNICKTETSPEDQIAREPSRVDRIMRRTIKQFKQWNRNMVKTAALDKVLVKLKNGTSWLTIKGNPGEGKTTVGYMALEDLQSGGREVFEVRSPDEFNEVIEACANPVIMLDDLFGALDYDQIKWTKWESAIRPFLQSLEHRSHAEKTITSTFLKDQEHESHDENGETSRDETDESQKYVTVILIGRDYILNSAFIDLGRHSEFLTSEKHVVLMDHTLERDMEEKLNIWKSISRCGGVDLETETVHKLLRLNIPHGFPHVCRLFTTFYKNNKAISAVDFFLNPLNFLYESISKLFKDRTKSSLLKEMVKCEGRINKRDVRQLDANYEMMQTAESLVGSYVRDEDSHFVFDHPSIYDSVAFRLSELDPAFVIQQCNFVFIHDRIRIKHPEHKISAYSSSPRCTVFIERCYEDDLAERFAFEIMAKKNFRVLSHQAFTDVTFVKKVISKLKTPLTSLLHVTDNFDNTFLFFVPSSKSPEFLKYIDNCPDIQLTEDDDNTLLHGTCEYAASKVLTYLKATRESLDLNVQFTKNKKSPLMIAAETRDIDFVLQILSLNPNVNTKDDFNRTALHYFCEYGLTSAVTHLADRATDLDVKDLDGRSPLWYACQYKHFNIVKLLVEKEATVDEKSLNAACATDDKTIVEQLLKKDNNLITSEVLSMSLFNVTKTGNVEIMKLLAEKGAVVNPSDPDCLPLHAACQNDELQAAMWLLEKEANIDCKDRMGETALHLSTGKGSSEFVCMLLKEGASVNIQRKEGDSALHISTARGSKECMEMLLKAGAAVNMQNCKGVTALYSATEWVSRDYVDVLLGSGAEVNIQNKEGNTPLHRAAEWHTNELVDMMLKADAKLNNQNIEGDTALHRAAGIGSSECVDLLLKAGAQVDIQNTEGDTPLNTAAARGSKECVDLLLKAGAKVNERNRKGDIAIHGAASWASKDCVDILLKAGASANMAGHQRNTALHRAAWRGSKECVDLLLKAGAGVTRKNKQGDTALHKAAWVGAYDCVDILINACASVNIRNRKGVTALYKAASSASTKCVNLLIEAGASVNMKYRKGETALHRSVESESEECMDMLLKADAELNMQNNVGNTALHTAAKRRSKGCVDVLLKAGAAVDITNAEGDTALQLAADRRSKDCINVLVEAGASIDMRNKEGKTALHIATERGSKHCVDTLIKAGAIVDIKNHAGDTALHMAAQMGFEECADSILRADAALPLFVRIKEVTQPFTEQQEEDLRSV